MLYKIKNNTTITPYVFNICLIIKGSITINHSNKIDTIASKRFFFFNTPFTINAVSPYLECYVTKLDDNFLNQHKDIDKALNSISTFFKSHMLKQSDTKQKQLQRILNTDASQQLKESYLHVLWSELLEDSKDGATSKTIVQQFEDLIEEHIEHNYCAGTYAEMLQIPLKKLIREVKKNENKTPCNFISEKVIDKAKHKLEHSTDTSQMIAFQLGFDDPYYFIKYFKKHTNLTPTQYRNKSIDVA